MDCGFMEVRKLIIRWYQSKTWLEQFLYKMFGISIVFAAVLSTVFVLVLTKINLKICLTYPCTSESSKLLNQLDITTNPCTNFYKFSCGTFLNRTGIPENRNYINIFTETEDKILEQLKHAIEEIDENSTSKPYKLLKEIYKNCMNASKQNNFQVLEEILNEIGGWPVMLGASWDEQNFDRTMISSKLRALGLSSDFLMELKVEPDYKNSSVYVLTLNQPEFLFMDKNVLKIGPTNEFVNVYYKFLVELAVAFGVNRTRAVKELKYSVEFETKLSQILVDEENLQNFTNLYNLKTIKELQHRYPSMVWLEYINDTVALDAFAFTSSYVVVVKAPLYFYKLEKLLLKTPKRVQANFLATRIILETLPFLNETFKEVLLDFKRNLYGQTENEPKYKICTRIASESLNLAANALYFEKFSSFEIQHRTEVIAAKLHEEFIKLLIKSNWLDLEVKNTIIEKLAWTRIQMGYPQKLLAAEKLEEIYSDWEIGSENFLENVMELKKLRLDSMYSKLGAVVDKDDWNLHVIPKKQKFYSYFSNSIKIPTGYLQDPFFVKNRPNYVNFGILGFLLGRELARTLDGVGLQFNKDGNLEDWWSDSSKATFMKNASCILEYLNEENFSSWVKINPSTTLNENFANLLGLKLAHRAYQTWTAKNGLEDHLPGITYNPNQIFWIYTSTSMCTKHRDEYQRILKLARNELPNQLQSKLIFNNLQVFDDFDCDLDQIIHKCMIL